MCASGLPFSENGRARVGDTIVSLADAKTDQSRAHASALASELIAKVWWQWSSARPEDLARIATRTSLSEATKAALAVDGRRSISMINVPEGDVTARHDAFVARLERCRCPRHDAHHAQAVASTASQLATELEAFRAARQST